MHVPKPSLEQHCSPILCQKSQSRFFSSVHPKYVQRRQSVLIDQIIFQTYSDIMDQTHSVNHRNLNISSLPKIKASLYIYKILYKICLSMHLHDISYRKCLAYFDETNTPMSIKHFYILVMDVFLL